MFKKFTWGSILVLLFFGTACVNNNLEDLQPAQSSNCDTSVTTFKAVIKPIVDNNCAISGCHTVFSRAGGYPLETYDEIKAAIDDNKFFESIAWTGSVARMPKGEPQLPDCDIAKIKRWIDRGAQNN